MHWILHKTKEPFDPNLDKFGFVYVITNTKTNKIYIGCKQYFIGKGKRKRKSNWAAYTGSSVTLNEDIEKIGKKNFLFEVIAEFKNKRSLRYYECYYQMKYNVLAPDKKGVRNFYNNYVQGKFFAPVEAHDE
jgi:hypothetical protein